MSPEKKPKKRLIGYARVSTQQQGLPRQTKALKRVGCAVIYSDKASGKSMAGRPELARALDDLDAGDELVIAEWDRATRSMWDPKLGLRIEAVTGPLSETDLSSGEYHFLYMMVSALLSHRSGSIIAIDEPELSLHVTWQRKIIRALARCAAGASPLFLFATHSAAVSAEHAERVIVLGVEE
jgi:hypothetical protein